MKKFDVDQNGIVDNRDFDSSLPSYKRTKSKLKRLAKKKKKFFDKFDADGDEEVDKQDILDVLKA